MQLDFTGLTIAELYFSGFIFDGLNMQHKKSGRHWIIMGFFYALFVQRSIFATIKNPSILSAQTRFL